MFNKLKKLKTKLWTLWVERELITDNFVVNKLLKDRPLTEREEFYHRTMFGHEYVDTNFSEEVYQSLCETSTRLKREKQERERKIWGETHEEYVQKLNERNIKQPKQPNQLV